MAAKTTGLSPRFVTSNLGQPLSEVCAVCLNESVSKGGMGFGVTLGSAVAAGGCDLDPVFASAGAGFEGGVVPAGAPPDESLFPHPAVHASVAQITTNAELFGSCMTECPFEEALYREAGGANKYDA